MTTQKSLGFERLLFMTWQVKRHSLNRELLLSGTVIQLTGSYMTVFPFCFHYRYNFKTAKLIRQSKPVVYMCTEKPLN